MFIDSSLKQKRRSEGGEEDEEDYLHLVVLSGVDNEGANILFGCGILKELTTEAFCWLLANFRQSNYTYTASGVYVSADDPEVVVTSCSEAVNTAVEIVFSHKTCHLYC